MMIAARGLSDKAKSSTLCRALSKPGVLADYPEEGNYRVLMEGIESFAGLMTLGSESEEGRNYRYREDGTRYVSTLRAR